jgi:hypothetical protein
VGEISPGVSGVTQSDSVITQENYIHSWIFFVLLALIIYLPVYLWGSYNHNFGDFLLMGLPRLEFENQNQAKRITHIIGFIYNFRDECKSIGVKFLFVNMLSLATNGFTIFLMNIFMKGWFLNYGTSICLGTTERGLSIEDIIFPLRAKCTIELFGYGGSIQTTDAVCELIGNHLNRNVFLFLW